MHGPRRNLVCAFALCAALIAPGMSLAQGNSSQPTRLVVPFSPGGAVDQVARTMRPALARELGEAVVVENKAGASGSLAAGEVAKASPDGRTLMLALDSHAVNHLTIKNLPYDTIESFEYLSLLVTLPQVLVVNSKLPVKSFDELIAHLKKNPNAAYGSAGTASAGHVNSAQLSLAKKLDSTHIPYKGAAPLLTDLLGGHIDYAFAGLSVMLPHIKSGAVRVLAISSPQRSSELPNVPAMKELIPGFEYPTWIGIVAPAGMSPEQKARVLAAVGKVMKDPEVAQRLKGMGFDIVNSTPAEFALRVKKDGQVMEDLVKRKIVLPD